MPSILAAIAALFFLSLWASDRVGRERPQNTVDRQKQGDQDSDERPEHIKRGEARFVAAHLHAIADHFHAHNDQSERQDNARASRERWTMGAAIVAGAATVASAVFLYCQIIDARTAAAIQHQDTINSLRLTKESNQINREAFASNTRAFVFLKYLPHSHHLIQGTPSTQYLYLWHNSGASQAKDLRIWSNCKANTSTAPLDFTEHTKELRQFIGPESEQTIFGCASSDLEITNLPSGWFFYVFGGATYADIFGARHRFEYCYQTNADDILPCDGLNAGHNCADEECVDK
jgi:hypothetical protein